MNYISSLLSFGIILIAIITLLIIMFSRMLKNRENRTNQQVINEQKILQDQQNQLNDIEQRLKEVEKILK